VTGDGRLHSGFRDSGLLEKRWLAVPVNVKMSGRLHWARGEMGPAEWQGLGWVLGARFCVGSRFRGVGPCKRQAGRGSPDAGPTNVLCCGLGIRSYLDRRGVGEMSQLIAPLAFDCRAGRDGNGIGI
jgi:hypothetical protein